MITGLPSVSGRNSARSDFSRQGRAPSRPMTPLAARATGPRVRSAAIFASDRDRRLDRPDGRVALERSTSASSKAKMSRARRQAQGRERAGARAQLPPRLVEMVEIEVRIAERVHELAGPQAAASAIISVSRA